MDAVLPGQSPHFAGESRRLLTVSLKYGDTFQVRYRESEAIAFSLEFLIDFDSGERRYDRAIGLLGAPVIHIGAGSSCQTG